MYAPEGGNPLKPVKNVADDILKYVFFILWENKMTFHVNSLPYKVIHMKCQILFSQKCKIEIF